MLLLSKKSSTEKKFGIPPLKNEIDESTKQEEQEKKKGFAIASLVFGIISGLSISSLVAIVLGHIALNKIKKNPNEYSGKGLAIAGLILGYLGLIIATITGVMRGMIINSLS